jgi:zinc transporter ZupT
MAFLNHSQFSAMQWLWFNLVGLLGGMIGVWIYVAIRPRFGAGPLTAVFAGVAVWLLTSAIPNFQFMWVLGLFEHHLTIFTTLGALAEIVIGTVLGAALYQEVED